MTKKKASSTGSEESNNGSGTSTESSVSEARSSGAPASSKAITSTAPIKRDGTGCKNDPEIAEELAGRSEIMRRKAKKSS